MTSLKPNAQSAPPQGINTRNESALHRTLKTLYSLQEGSQTEVPLDGKVYDVVDATGGIIEIQTSSVSSLLGKAEAALAHGRTVKVVHPIAARKTIESYDEDANLVRKKPSPLRLSVYNMWREITGLVPLLLQSGFSLEVLEVEMTEVRTLLALPAQSANRCRRYKKAWNKADKRLDKVLCTHTFTSASDYTALLPKACPAVFCAKDVAAALLNDKALPRSASHQAGYMLWVLSRMGLIEDAAPPAGKRDRGAAKYYTRPSL